MFPTLLNIGPITISPLTLLVPLAFMVASFILWRNLKEDYSEEEIISLTIYLTLVFLLGARLVHIFYHFERFQFSLLKWLLVVHYPGFSFFGGFLACIGLLVFWSKRKKWDFWQVVEVIIPAWFWVMVLVGSGLYLTSGELIFLGEAFLGFLLLLLARFLKKRYRSFIWYKSGKLGFVSCLSTAFFMMGKLMLEIFSRGSLYWEGILPLSIAVTCLVFLYQRSGRNWREDLSFSSIRKKQKIS
jgi:prolipoprotein diacylglyceryltransferase